MRQTFRLSSFLCKHLSKSQVSNNTNHWYTKLRKESLNSDGHQFHQYQQNEQSPLIPTDSLKTKKVQNDMTLEIQVLAWDRYKNVTGLNRLMGSQLSLLLTGPPTAIRIYTNDKKICTDSIPLKKTIYYHKNEWQHKYGQYNSRINEVHS